MNAIGVGSTVGVGRGKGVELGEGVEVVVGVMVARWKGVSVAVGLGEGSDWDAEGVRLDAGGEESTRTAAVAVDDA